MEKASARFNGIASNYAQSEVHRMSPTIERLHAYISTTKKISVCDVACGAGHTALSFVSIADRIVGVDDSPEMLKTFLCLAESQNFNVETINSNAENIPLPDGSFDLVVSRLAPHHFVDIKQALREMCRILKYNGKLIIIDLEGNEDPKIDAFNHKLEMLHDPTHIRSYTAEAWRSMIEELEVKIDVFEPRQIESPEGVSIHRWCEIAASGEAAENKILQLLKSAPDDWLKSLGIRNSGETYKMPIRTILIIAHKSE